MTAYLYTNPTIPAGATIAVYQHWNADRDALTQKTPRKKCAVLFNTADCYCGSFDLSWPINLEDIFILLQNDTHPEGWVKATGAQDGWITGGSSPSLSVGDVIAVHTGEHKRERTSYLVRMMGFDKVTDSAL